MARADIGAALCTTFQVNQSFHCGNRSSVNSAPAEMKNGGCITTTWSSNVDAAERPTNHDDHSSADSSSSKPSRSIGLCVSERSRLRTRSQCALDSSVSRAIAESAHRCASGTALSVRILITCSRYAALISAY
jgi:hypothetical protein